MELNLCSNPFKPRLISVPWMACPEEECAEMARRFEKDMYSKEFKSLAMVCGGKDVDKRMTENLRFASKMGFMEMIGNDD